MSKILVVYHGEIGRFGASQAHEIIAFGLGSSGLMMVKCADGVTRHLSNGLQYQIIVNEPASKKSLFGER